MKYILLVFQETVFVELINNVLVKVKLKNLLMTVRGRNCDENEHFPAIFKEGQIADTFKRCDKPSSSDSGF